LKYFSENAKVELRYSSSLSNFGNREFMDLQVTLRSSRAIKLLNNKVITSRKSQQSFQPLVFETLAGDMRLDINDSE